MHGRAGPGDQLALVEDRHDQALIGVVDVAVACVVVDKAIALANADGGIVFPVFLDELDRVMDQAGEQQNTAGTADGKVAARREHPGDEVAPLGARRGTHLLEHLEGFVAARLETIAHQCQHGWITLLLHRRVFHLRARRDVVVLHDLGIGPQEQDIVRQELANEFLLAALVTDVFKLSHF